MNRKRGDFFASYHILFRQNITWMKMFSTIYMDERYVVVAFREKISTIQGQSFNQKRQKDWVSMGSSQQEERSTKNKFRK